MSADTSTPRSRRAILASALGGLGAVVASRMIKPETARAAPGDPVTVDAEATGLGTTSITSSTGLETFVAKGQGTAILGFSGIGTGLKAQSQSTDPSDFQNPSHRTGVLAVVGTDSPVQNTDEVAVYGYCNVSSSSTGIWGDSNDGYGVVGTGGTGVLAGGYYGVYAFGRAAVTGDASEAQTGLYGFSGATDAPLPPAGVGVQATAGSTAQIALNVSGKAKFSRSGRTYVATGKYSRRVNMAGVTTASYIIATLQTRRTGVYVHAVVPATGYFVIYLNKAVTANTYVGYLVIN